MAEQKDSHAQDAGASDPIAWIKATYLMWLKGDLEPEHMRLGQNFFDARRAAAARTPAACEQPDIDTLAQFIRDAEREHGQCDDDDTYISYRPTARAILQKFDVRPKHSSTVGLTEIGPFPGEDDAGNVGISHSPQVSQPDGGAK